MAFVTSKAESMMKKYFAPKTRLLIGGDEHECEYGVIFQFFI